MIFMSGNKNISIDVIGCRYLGFGEKLKVKSQSFELTIGLNELSNDFIVKADIFIEECKTDDLSQGCMDIPELGKLGYPSFLELFRANKEVAASLIQDFLYANLFEELFSRKKKYELVINNIYTTTISGNKITINGEVFITPPIPIQE
ncbi:hypothetical protein PUP66_02310 [Pseudomonas chlororaphis]|uniref:hypothetical protein n=1 Tax=Pseudomonas chlororaphis TaxID=587753 RepID=UPI000E0B474B|nr:hypothetical protein [Pseudomonas chlororaphis]AZD13188.1 hypothetical protein C4K25_0228 [Pseudomonas chlororaphis]WDH47726.1 hypothetical protein PUP66_02310 [Pseudomonas chlororaphis]WDH59573.1 hypothetical protein PUP56_02310 [Pseudomonas chlororaphis]WQE18829.1 hypothetical protein U0007_01125 [Pseudomonas chlororaphis]